MEYSVGSLADLITGSNTPNKPKVVKKKLVKVEPENTPEIQKSPKKNKKKELVNVESPDTPKIKKSPKKDITKSNIKKGLKNNNDEPKLENTENTEDGLDDKIEKKKKKRKLNDSSIHTAEDETSESSPKKLKTSKRKNNAERRIKNKERMINNTNIEELERTIFVGNIPIQIDKKKVKQYFRKYGKIESIRIRGIPVADPKMSKKVAAIKKEFNPNRKNVNCYLRFTNKEDAIQAAEENGTLFEGHHLRVHVCSSKDDPDETKAIFVGNLSFNAEEDELWKLFETCGPISHVRIIRDFRTGMGKGFGYVNFKDSDAVQLALEMENVKLGDRELRIALSNLKVSMKKKKKNNKKNFQNGKPIKKDGDKDTTENGISTKNKLKNVTKNFQGTKFSDKKKKHKVNKGFLQKKTMIKKIAPKVNDEST